MSLPLGSAVGLALRPSLSTAAVLAAFGAGALIAAVTIELVAPTVQHIGESGGHAGAAAFWILAAGALAGGLLFVAVDRALASRGGFLRKVSTAIGWFTREARQRNESYLKELCAIPLLWKLPSEQVELLIRDVRAESYSEEETLFEEGEVADELFFVRSGEVELSRGGEHVRTVGAGGIFGELPLLAGIPRTVSAQAKGRVEALVLRGADFERWRAECPEFDLGFREMASERLEEIRERDAVRSQMEQSWGEQAIGALRQGTVVPSPAEIRQAAEARSGAGLAVWLGMLIDGIPESIVIGSGFLGILRGRLASGTDVAFAEVVPYTLIAGLFLANFPEALSSSLAMRTQGWSRMRVLSMWSALMVITAAGAGVGYAIGGAVPHYALIAIEGVAAGAMITTIVSTMIPEAVHLAGSGSRVGISTLVGFFAAVSFKLLE